jgi:anion-transporting  ArsA/GET3 family ATPase
VSSRARLILHSGIGGAGTTTISAAAVAALQAEGLHVEAIDASEPLPPDPSVIDRLTSSLGRVFADVGADPALAEEWSTLSVVSHLSALALIDRALSDASVDAVVVDCGDHRRARELVDLPAVLTRLLDSILTPRLAMWRSAGATTEGALFDALSAARADVLRLAHLLAHSETTMRLVSAPNGHAVSRTEHAIAAFSLLGVAVDGVVVNRFPRKSEGWPSSVTAEADAALARLTESADGVAVWKSTSSPRAVPKGRSAMGPLGRVQVLDADQLTVLVADEGFALELRLAGPARDRARVGVQGDCLVVDFDGVVRWLQLPPMLRRCVPTHADRTESGLRVAFTPDPATWRQPGMVS